MFSAVVPSLKFDPAVWSFKCCKYQFANAWRELVIHWVIFHISYLYNKTDLTFVLNNEILVLRYFYSSKLSTSVQRPHLPSWCDFGHPLSSTIYSNYSAKVCKRFNLFHIYTVYCQHQVCPRVDCHLLSFKYVYFKLYLCANTQKSSAKSRSSGIFIILHCIPLFLSFYYCSWHCPTLKEIGLEIIHIPVCRQLLLGRSWSGFLRVSYNIWILHMGLWSCIVFFGTLCSSRFPTPDNTYCFIKSKCVRLVLYNLCCVCVRLTCWLGKE